MASDMDLSELRRHLDPRNSSIRSSFGDTLADVTFFEGGTLNSVLRLLVDPVKKTYQVGSSSTCCTSTFQAVAAAYTEATRFIAAAELSPAV
jgi:hypothetical protein